MIFFFNDLIPAVSNKPIKQNLEFRNSFFAYITDKGFYKNLINMVLRKNLFQTIMKAGVHDSYLKWSIRETVYLRIVSRKISFYFCEIFANIPMTSQYVNGCYTHDVKLCKR